MLVCPCVRSCIGLYAFAHRGFYHPMWGLQSLFIYDLLVYQSICMSAYLPACTSLCLSICQLSCLDLKTSPAVLYTSYFMAARLSGLLQIRHIFPYYRLRLKCPLLSRYVALPPKPNRNLFFPLLIYDCSAGVCLRARLLNGPMQMFVLMGCCFIV